MLAGCRRAQLAGYACKIPMRSRCQIDVMAVADRPRRGSTRRSRRGWSSSAAIGSCGRRLPGEPTAAAAAPKAKRRLISSAVHCAIVRASVTSLEMTTAESALSSDSNIDMAQCTDKHRFCHSCVSGDSQDACALTMRNVSLQRGLTDTCDLPSIGKHCRETCAEAQPSARA